MEKMTGTGVSPGIAIGKALVIQRTDAVLTGILLHEPSEKDAAVTQFEKALSAAISELESIKSDLALNADDHDLLNTHIEILSDPELTDSIIEKIRSEHRTAGDAVLEVINTFASIFENMSDDYMRARAADIKDIGRRIHLNLSGDKKNKGQIFKPGTILIADDLSPSETITFDLKLIAGFITRKGSRTSHTAIIAKSKGLPAIVGCTEAVTTIKDGDTIILDGSNGVVFVNPGEDLTNEYLVKLKAWKQHADSLRSLKDIEASTKDGVRIRLSANISKAEEWEETFDNGGEGVGLLRTELLFMDRESFPSEDEQFEFYRQVALQSKGKPVIIRTIDIGGDKQIPYFGLPAEPNPFLGYRAIRICLDQKELFSTQLKAILRASVFGDLKIMFPMISNIGELREAKSILKETKTTLRNNGIAFNADIKTGIMIEIPSAAITADLLAKETDFFSIGTNDLCQYTLAVDRMNEKITHLYEPFNPAVLRLIKFVIEQGQKNNLYVGMCGEMAADPLATLLLAGMGLRDFSMSPSAIPVIKNIILHSTLKMATEICHNVMNMNNAEEIRAYLKTVVENK
ncbi:MAG TPA: phosphoenolpyruvate--protein phosphotransferase [Mucilaginibacter sp.]|nr:phosphoenolpyruvate--protein phosphotransferase [Mucilaginibacter sp.]